jgi:hypothetical protein
MENFIWNIKRHSIKVPLFKNETNQAKMIIDYLNDYATQERGGLQDRFLILAINRSAESPSGIMGAEYTIWHKK